MEQYLIQYAQMVVIIAETGGALVILASTARALIVYAVEYLLSRGRPPGLLGIRFDLGRGLVLALEFFIAADIVRTILAPTIQEIGFLAAIIAVRTGLAFSIEYELRQARQTEEQLARQREER